MISAKKLIKLARKWQKMAAIRRKRITLPRIAMDADANSCSTSSVVEKGHFVVYSLDQKRFVLPSEYLKNKIVMELFNLAEEVFGQYVVSLIKRNLPEFIEKALLTSIATGHCSASSYLHQEPRNQPSLICSF